MANGHVEIHDPLPDRGDVTSTGPETRSTSEDCPELRLLRAYAKRRRPQKVADPAPPNTLVAQMGGTHDEKPSPPQNEEEEKKKKRKKRRRGLKHLAFILPCIKPQTEDEGLPRIPEDTPTANTRCFFKGDDEEEKEEAKEEEEEELEMVVSRLTELADEIQFSPPDVEPDAPGDDVEKVIALLLRETGDRVNEELKAASVDGQLFLNFPFFETLMSRLLERMGLRSPQPDALGPQASPKTQIAVTCEVTTRLSTLVTLPNSRMLNHGAQYLQMYYSPWIQQQGGYEEAFHSDDEDEVQ